MIKKESSFKTAESVKVVELGEFITAPFCSKIWADVGAEVIKIEKPLEGDKSRRHGPFPNDKPHPEKSGLFLFLNTNKKSITLNVKKPGGHKILKGLLKDTDILVENNPPKLMEELGLDYASLKQEFPRLIMVSITQWGQTGPYRDYKGHCLNQGCLSYFVRMGNANREPLDHAMSFCDYAAGLAGATASMIAFFDREITGIGRQCDIASFQNIMVNYAGPQFEMWKVLKQFGMRGGGRMGGTMWYPSEILPVKDGYYCFLTFEYQHWKRLMDILGNPEWAKDPRFNFPPEQEPMGVYLMGQYADELDANLLNEIERFTKAQLFDKCFKAGTSFVPVMDMADVVNSPQVKFRNEIVEIDHPVAGKLKYPGAPAAMDKTPVKIDRPAPLLGQHNREIYCSRLGYTDAKLAKLNKAGIV